MNLSDILKSFCAKDEVRHYMNAPILRGEFIFATNGHAMVRVAKFDGIDGDYGDKQNNIEDLINSAVRDGLAPISGLPDPKLCECCHGTGYAYRCKSCDGEGSFLHNGEEYDCKPCNSYGTIPDGDEADKVECWACHGSCHKQQRVEVGGSDFDRRYLAKIMDLPGALFAPHPTDQSKPAYFTFDGGDGVLMPMRK